MDHKKGIRSALDRYFEKTNKKSNPVKKKYNKPEKEVEKQVLQYCRSLGWFVHVVESKAVYSKTANRYLNQQATSGFPDVVGLTPAGIFVAIELKAKHRRSNLRPQQRDFLMNCIERHGFAVVTDSVTFLESAYQSWLKSDNKKQTLVDLLPKQKQTDDNEPLFTD